MDVFYWSFQVSQGSNFAQRQALLFVFISFPEYKTALKALQVKFGATPYGEQQNIPEVAALIERAVSRVSSSAHGVQITNPKSSEVEVLKHLANSFRDLPLIEKAEGINECIDSFIEDTLDTEIGFIKKTLTGMSLYEKRRKMGYSMLCGFGLSQDREKRLKSLPAPLQSLWRASADRIRSGLLELNDMNKARLSSLIKLYQKETGENLAVTL